MPESGKAGLKLSPPPISSYASPGPEAASRLACWFSELNRFTWARSEYLL